MSCRKLLPMRLRRATMDDALDVLAWRNDPHTIAMSKTPGVLDRASHMAWFARAVRSEDRVIFIALEADMKLGMVRFDRTGDAWLVSINVAPEQRGTGYGSRLLNDAIELFHSLAGDISILAEVKCGNEASLRIFERCGFVREVDKDGWLSLIRRRQSKS